MAARTRWRVPVEEPELPFPPFPSAVSVATLATSVCEVATNPFAVFECCPMCGGSMAPEHAHFRCGTCGWRDSCCD